MTTQDKIAVDCLHERFLLRILGRDDYTVQVECADCGKIISMSWDEYDSYFNDDDDD